MTWKSIFALVALCLVLCLAVGLMTDVAHAQSTTGADKTQAVKETGTLGTKECDKEKLPGKLEVGLAIGSLITVVAVFKYL